MAKTPTLTNFTTFTNDSSAVTVANANNTALTTAFNNTLSLDGSSPNSMGADLDMNNHNILNLPAPATLNSPVRLVDVVANGASVTVPPTGTSGHVVPFLDGNNTFSGTDTFSGNVTLAGTNTVSGATTFSGTVALGGSATATTPGTSDNSTTVATTAYVKAQTGLGNIAGLSVLGNAGTVSAAPAAITGTANQILGVNSGGTAVAFETVSGDATLSSGALTLATVNANVGSFGDATHIPTVTVNGKGLVTAASQTALAPAASSLTGTALPAAIVTSSLTTLANAVVHGADSATPAASSLTGQSVLAGTTNTPGTDLTIAGGKSTGTGVGGKVKIATSAAGSTGSSQNASTTHLTVDGPGNVVVGTGSQNGTTATDGFLYVSTVAGIPTGGPTSYGIGCAAMQFDTTNNKLWVYNPVSAAWKSVALA